MAQPNGGFDFGKFTKAGKDPIRAAVEDLIYNKYRNTPRHLQVALGPSEIGEPCTRRLAYNLMHHTEYRDGDPLPSIVGTAAHTWMEKACHEFNVAAGRVIWIPEGTVNVDKDLDGHSDAYNVDLETVFDWKFPGPSRLAKYKREGIGNQYRVQLHGYGRGWIRKGFVVRRVACICLPRGGFLKDAYYDVETFDDNVVSVALDRYYGLTELCIQMDVEQYPERYALFPKETGHDCQFCPWFKMTLEDDGNTCPGYTNEKNE